MFVFEFQALVYICTFLLCFSEGSVNVDVGLGYIDEPTPEVVFREVSAPVEREFTTLVTNTLQVRTPPDTSTTDDVTEMMTTTFFEGTTDEPEPTTPRYVCSSEPSDCSGRGQFATDIYTQCTICDCELGYYGDTCSSGEYFRQFLTTSGHC